MEKFSGKEKIALVIFGLILLAIIIQVAVRINIFNPPAPPWKIVEDAELDLSGNLLQEPGVVLDASSHNEESQVVEKLKDAKPDTFWHVALDRLGEPAWVTIDFGEGNEKTIHSLMAKPRNNFPRQFFRTAELLGSDTGEDWKPVAEIVQWGTPDNSKWRRWDFANDRAFRYYKFAIADGHEGGQFYSMAELALFE